MYCSLACYRKLHPGSELYSVRRGDGISSNTDGTDCPFPVPVDLVDFFRSGSGPVTAKYRPDQPDLTSKFGCMI